MTVKLDLLTEIVKDLEINEDNSIIIQNELIRLINSFGFTIPSDAEILFSYQLSSILGRAKFALFLNDSEIGDICFINDKLYGAYNGKSAIKVEFNGDFIKNNYSSLLNGQSKSFAKSIILNLNPDFTIVKKSVVFNNYSYDSSNGDFTDKDRFLASGLILSFDSKNKVEAVLERTKQSYHEQLMGEFDHRKVFMVLLHKYHLKEYNQIMSDFSLDFSGRCLDEIDKQLTLIDILII